jgi:hypothetical protein
MTVGYTYVYVIKELIDNRLLPYPLLSSYNVFEILKLRIFFSLF